VSRAESNAGGNCSRRLNLDLADFRSCFRNVPTLPVAMKRDYSLRTAIRLSQALLLAGVLFGLSGCMLPSLRGPAFNDEPKIGRKPVDSTVSPNQGASLYGFSTKARQIEGNLGVE
jgi:hypothetical protein